MVAPEELRDASGDRKGASRVHAAVSLAGVLSPSFRNASSMSVGASLLADLRGRAAREQLAVEHQEQLVAAIRLVHDVAADEECFAVRGKPAEVFPELDAQLQGRCRPWARPGRSPAAGGRARMPAKDACACRPTTESGVALRRSYSSTTFSASSSDCLVDLTRQGAEEAHVLPDRQLGVDAVGLGHVADRGPGSRGRASGRPVREPRREVGLASPVSRRMSVVLPEPLGPSRP